MTLQVAACRLQPGDHVTGIWSDVRHRWDPDNFTVARPVGTTRLLGNTPVTVVPIGPQVWEIRHYHANTVCRVLGDRSAQ